MSPRHFEDSGREAVTDKQALLVMDYQVGVVERFNGKPELLARVRSALDAARQAGVPVIFVRVAFRDGYPEIGSGNPTFAAIAAGGDTFYESSPATQIHPALAPEPDELIVTKRRVGAFSGSDLEVILRSQGIQTLVLSGIGTGGVVLSTLRHAADLDYGLIVLSDACADNNEIVNKTLLEHVFPRQGEVLSVANWIERISKN